MDRQDAVGDAKVDRAPRSVDASGPRDTARTEGEARRAEGDVNALPADVDNDESPAEDEDDDDIASAAPHEGGDDDEDDDQEPEQDEPATTQRAPPTAIDPPIEQDEGKSQGAKLQKTTSERGSKAAGSKAAAASGTTIAKRTSQSTPPDVVKKRSSSTSREADETRETPNDEESDVDVEESSTSSLELVEEGVQNKKSLSASNSSRALPRGRGAAGAGGKTKRLPSTRSKIAPAAEGERRGSSSVEEEEDEDAEEVTVATGDGQHQHHAKKKSTSRLPPRGAQQTTEAREQAKRGASSSSNGSGTGEENRARSVGRRTRTAEKPSEKKASAFKVGAPHRQRGANSDRGIFAPHKRGREQEVEPGAGGDEATSGGKPRRKSETALPRHLGKRSRRTDGRDDSVESSSAPESGEEEGHSLPDVVRRPRKESSTSRVGSKRPKDTATVADRPSRASSSVSRSKAAVGKKQVKIVVDEKPRRTKPEAEKDTAINVDASSRPVHLLAEEEDEDEARRRRGRAPVPLRRKASSSTSFSESSSSEEEEEEGDSEEDADAAGPTEEEESGGEEPSESDGSAEEADEDLRSNAEEEEVVAADQMKKKTPAKPPRKKVPSQAEGASSTSSDASEEWKEVRSKKGGRTQNVKSPSKTTSEGRSSPPSSPTGAPSVGGAGSATTTPGTTRSAAKPRAAAKSPTAKDAADARAAPASRKRREETSSRPRERGKRAPAPAVVKSTTGARAGKENKNADGDADARPRKPRPKAPRKTDTASDASDASDAKDVDSATRQPATDKAPAPAKKKKKKVAISSAADQPPGSGLVDDPNANTSEAIVDQSATTTTIGGPEDSVQTGGRAGHHRESSGEARSKRKRAPSLELHAEDEVVEQSPKGRFSRFNRRLGAGSYKQVYLGFDNDTGREIAWNVISFSKMSETEMKRIQEEISITKSLNHSRIIHCMSAWKNSEHEEVIFITERVTGGSLRSYVNRLGGPLKLKVIRNWSRQILEGLAYLHTHLPSPVIHRDLKCDNIFINGNVGQILIGDLGLSSWLKSASRHGMAQSVVGTPEFMAPELYEERYGTPVDIYAFGMCLVEMVSRQFPFAECNTTVQVYNKVMKGERPKVIKRIKDEKLKSFIETCLEKDPGLRPTAEELMQHAFLTTGGVDGGGLENERLQPADLQIGTEEDGGPGAADEVECDELAELYESEGEANRESGDEWDANLGGFVGHSMVDRSKGGGAAPPAGESVATTGVVAGGTRTSVAEGQTASQAQKPVQDAAAGGATTSSVPATTPPADPQQGAPTARAAAPPISTAAAAAPAPPPPAPPRPPEVQQPAPTAPQPTAADIATAGEKAGLRGFSQGSSGTLPPLDIPGKGLGDSGTLPPLDLPSRRGDSGASLPPLDIPGRTQENLDYLKKQEAAAEALPTQHPQPHVAPAEIVPAPVVPEQRDGQGHMQHTHHAPPMPPTPAPNAEEPGDPSSASAIDSSQAPSRTLTFGVVLGPSSDPTPDAIFAPPSRSVTPPMPTPPPNPPAPNGQSQNPAAPPRSFVSGGSGRSETPRAAGGFPRPGVERLNNMPGFAQDDSILQSPKRHDDYNTNRDPGVPVIVPPLFPLANLGSKQGGMATAAAAASLDEPGKPGAEVDGPEQNPATPDFHRRGLDASAANINVLAGQVGAQRPDQPQGPRPELRIPEDAQLGVTFAGGGGAVVAQSSFAAGGQNAVVEFAMTGVEDLLNEAPQLPAHPPQLHLQGEPPAAEPATVAPLQEPLQLYTTPDVLMPPTYVVQRVVSSGAEEEHVQAPQTPQHLREAVADALLEAVQRQEQEVVVQQPPAPQLHPGDTTFVNQQPSTSDTADVTTTTQGSLTPPIGGGAVTPPLDGAGQRQLQPNEVKVVLRLDEVLGNATLASSTSVSTGKVVEFEFDLSKDDCHAVAREMLDAGVLDEYKPPVLAQKTDTDPDSQLTEAVAAHVNRAVAAEVMARELNASVVDEEDGGVFGGGALEVAVREMREHMVAFKEQRRLEKAAARRRMLLAQQAVLEEASGEDDSFSTCRGNLQAGGEGSKINVPAHQPVPVPPSSEVEPLQEGARPRPLPLDGDKNLVHANGNTRGGGATPHHDGPPFFQRADSSMHLRTYPESMLPNNVNKRPLAEMMFGSFGGPAPAESDGSGPAGDHPRNAAAGSPVSPPRPRFAHEAFPGTPEGQSRTTGGMDGQPEVEGQGLEDTNVEDVIEQYVRTGGALPVDHTHTLEPSGVGAEERTIFHSVLAERDLSHERVLADESADRSLADHLDEWQRDALEKSGQSKGPLTTSVPASDATCGGRGAVVRATLHPDDTQTDAAVAIRVETRVRQARSGDRSPKLRERKVSGERKVRLGEGKEAPAASARVAKQPRKPARDVEPVSADVAVLLLAWIFYDVTKLSTAAYAAR